MNHSHSLKWRTLLAAGLLLAGVGCGGTRVSRVALLSDGDLAGRRLTPIPPGPTLSGEDCGMYHHLSNAFRNATSGSGYDTLVDVEVSNRTGATPFATCIKVAGRGVKSADLPHTEERQ